VHSVACSDLQYIGEPGGMRIIPSVVAETIEILRERSPVSLNETLIADIVIGIFFTGVKLTSGHAGVAFTPAADIPEAVCCPTSAARMPQAGKLEGKSVSEIINYALDGNVLKSAIGVATLNAVSHAILDSPRGREMPVIRDADGFDLLDIKPKEKVSLVGAFAPYIRRLKQMGNPFFIIERNPRTLRADEMDYYRSENQLSQTVSESDVLIMTGTAIVNHTIDSILSALRAGQRSAIVGPTASMVPDAFFGRGVDVLAGIRLIDADLMIKVLKQGGSAYHLLHQCSEKIAFRRTGAVS
jgi:uncharacterized protein